MKHVLIMLISHLKNSSGSLNQINPLLLYHKYLKWIKKIDLSDFVQKKTFFLDRNSQPGGDYPQKGEIGFSEG